MIFAEKVWMLRFKIGRVLDDFCTPFLYQKGQMKGPSPQMGVIEIGFRIT
jgi:hypothetical protein